MLSSVVIWACLTILGLCSININQANAASIGSITESQSAPSSIKRSSETLSGAKGTKLEMDDAIRTTQGKVGLTFIDDTKVQITEHSKLVIDNFVYDPNNKKGGKLVMKVALGTVRYASGQVAKNNPQAVSINTPTATIRVRGTDFTATVDELGRSTIILLPSCRFGWLDLVKDCKTGEIDVTTESGMVVMNQAYQATRVESKESKPSPPVTLNLSEDQISNILILSPPKELAKNNRNESTRKDDVKGVLNIDFLKEQGLANVIEKDQKELFLDKLSKNLLDNEFLQNILDQIDAQMAAQLNLLSNTKKGLLPDYVATSGVTVELDDIEITLCRENSGDVQCVTTPRGQSSTIFQQQGSVEIMNRVNSGNNSIIILRQN